MAKNKGKISIPGLAIAIVTLFVVFKFKAYWITGFVTGGYFLVCGLLNKPNIGKSPQSNIKYGLIIIGLNIIYLILHFLGV